MGYRKSLEFLIKDYAIAFHPDKETDIVKSQLSPCINEYIDNKRINLLRLLLHGLEMMKLITQESMKITMLNI